MKGARAVVSFIGALLLSEVITYVIFFFLSSSLFFVPDNHRDNVIEVTIPVEQTANHKTAGIVVEAFKKSDIKTIYAYFDETMKNGISEKELKDIWTGLILSYGKLKNADMNVEAKHFGKHELLLMPCTFDRAKLNLCLTFNEDGEIAGLYFR
jgi:hypothetical protein